MACCPCGLRVRDSATDVTEEERKSVGRFFREESFQNVKERCSEDKCSSHSSKGWRRLCSHQFHPSGRKRGEGSAATERLGLESSLSSLE
ncbi:hypothetical protein E2C01_098566 [Portunus trituberculatus]|uniref:Uncharacterized protein n=1 Tax=Portunus trituberculatus TaxID=210409 RepID=A0A5B7K8R0_PORTR|nr:hypothetical protein [Portunus trituberculatus]